MILLSNAALAQARYALFEKHLKVCDALRLAREVFKEDSDNVVFWSGEEQRVRLALNELGGRP